MKPRRLSDKLTCEQVYSVWSTEPELIQILDLRSPEEFESFHVPGARNLTLDSLDTEILRLDGRLGVIVAPPAMLPRLEEAYGRMRDVAILKDCERWRQLHYPIEGKSRAPRRLPIQMINGIPEVTVEDVYGNLGAVRIIDVRGPDEFDGELGHIPGAELVTLGPKLTEFLMNENLNQEIVFVCRSGARSGRATADSMKAGFGMTANMTGGMLRWRELYAK